MRHKLLTSDHVEISIDHPPIRRPKVVILCPGFFQSKETKTFQRIANDLRLKWDVIAMDFRGHGRSGGLYTFSSKESEDLKAVADYARSSYRRVGVLGFSYGGAIAINQQAKYRNVDSVASVSAPAAPDRIRMKWWKPESIRLGVRGLERGAGVRIGNPFLKKPRTMDLIASLEPTPVFLIHAKNDPTIDVSHAHHLYQNAQKPKQLELLNEGSHAQEIYRQKPEYFINMVNQWFDVTL